MKKNSKILAKRKKKIDEGCSEKAVGASTNFKITLPAQFSDNLPSSPPNSTAEYLSLIF